MAGIVRVNTTDQTTEVDAVVFTKQRLTAYESRSTSKLGRGGNAIASTKRFFWRTERGGLDRSKPMRQWMLKITAYAERLQRDPDELDWPESIRLCSVTGSVNQLVPMWLQLKGTNKRLLVLIFWCDLYRSCTWAWFGRCITSFRASRNINLNFTNTKLASSLTCLQICHKKKLGVHCMPSTLSMVREIQSGYRLCSC